MDAAQMLTAHEIAQECERLARSERDRSATTPERSDVRGTSRSPGGYGHLRLADPITQPIPTVDDPGEEEPGEGELSDLETRLLAFERQWWKRSGSKERAIYELFELAPARYYQLLNALLDRPEARKADPMLVKRLRKARVTGQQARELGTD